MMGPWLRKALVAGGIAACGWLPGSEARAQAAPVRLAPLVQQGLAAPLYATHAGDGSGRLFVVERGGRIRIITSGGSLVARPFLDIAGRVLAGGEQGLLGLAFHPGYRSNGRFFVNYTRRPDGATVVAEFRVSGDPGLALPGSGRVLLTVPQPFANHNGGMLAFGQQGRLFIGLGDGGSGGDPGNRAQNRQSLLGKILRIDVDGARPYAIPADNPFAGGGGRGEIYALGFRNPWRFSIDRVTGALFAGDVGQETVEEINVVRRGGNYGWRIMEGTRCFSPATGCNRAGLALPVTSYLHTGGRCSVTGGYVYRGRAIPSLVGAYLFADFCTGEIFAFRAGQGATRILDTPRAIVSFGETQAGELVVVDIGGSVHRLLRAG